MAPPFTEIGIATQHPPLPDANQLSDVGIDFIRQCLTIDAMNRPTAVELMQHLWVRDFSETVRAQYEKEMGEGAEGVDVDEGMSPMSPVSPHSPEEEASEGPGSVPSENYLPNTVKGLETVDEREE